MTKHYFWVGVLVFVASLVFGYSLFLIGDQHKAFRRHIDYFVEFANVDGVFKGAKALKWAVWSRLLNCGQGCVCAKRFLIAEGLYDRFVKGVEAVLGSLHAGDPMHKDTKLGPLSASKARDILLDQMDRAKKGGATIVVGGNAMDRPASYFEPAILENI